MKPDFNIPMRRNRKQGFTLVEIMLVVVIIGLLAAMANGLVRNSVASGKAARAAGRFATASMAFEAFFSETGNYPPDAGPGQVPAGMADYFAACGVTWWGSAELGGSWEWDNDGAVRAVALSGATETTPLEKAEKLLDLNPDANRFRKEGSKYLYVLD